MQHDGADWSVIPSPANVAVTHIDVGHDGRPFAIAQPTAGTGGFTLHAYDPASSSWQTPVALAGITPQQLAVGDATRVYVLGSDGMVNRLQEGDFAPVSELGSNVKHLTVNHDGTVWHSDDGPNAYRFISERSYPPTPLAIPNADSVQKVASTAYGNALVLDGANQLHSYTSPFVFKTSPSFPPIANSRLLLNPQIMTGGGRCYINIGAGIAALDSHTGAEEWTAPASGGSGFNSMIYDPHQQLVYATDANSNRLVALDAATGAQQWYFAPDCSPMGQPVVSGTGICITAANMVYWIDTVSARAQGLANGTQSVGAIWETGINTIHDIPRESCIPNYYQLSIGFINAGKVYVIASTEFQNGETDIWTLSAQDGSKLSSSPVDFAELPSEVTPVLGRMNFSGNGDGDANLLLALNFGATINTSAASANGIFEGVGGDNYPPTGSSFSRGLALYNGVLYVGASDGRLYSLQDASGNTPVAPWALGSATEGGFVAGPVAAPNGAGGVLLAFSGHPAGNSSANSIWIYEPATQNLVEVETDHLLATQLTVDENGILYAAGWDPNDPNSPFGQVYAIRIDDVLQQERFFIVESDLMQDFDEDTPAQLTTTARYQTHVTVVDANKAPRPFQAIKVWADTSAALLIDGKPYTVDATTPASVQTDATGSLTIVSDATDLSTGALKLWAGFMDPYERIVVYPDREFHSRLTTAHYESTANPDPTRINLATAAPYDTGNLTNPPPLFSSGEQSQATVAAAVTSKLTTAVGYQSGGTPALSRSMAATTAAAGAYLAYDDLTGAAYSPVATPANRAVIPTASGGFSFDGTTMVELTPATAAEAIDALDGSAEELPGSFISWLRGLWDDIKKGVSKVAHIVVSIGRDIYAGIKYVVDGVVKVLRVALRDIVDVAIAIGSVFVQLGKDIIKVAEALSIIFHLGAVLETANTIKSVFATLTTNFATSIAGVKPTVDGFFQGAEDAINNAFANIATELEGASMASLAATAGAGIGGLSGMGATPRTVFAVGPKGSGQNSSQAVPAMWGMHKLRQNYANATTTATATDNPLSQFLQSFHTTYEAQISQVNNNFHAQIKVGSPKEFFASLLVDLLDALKTLVDDVLVVLNALLDGVIDAAAGIVDLLGAAGGVEIPILSAIWKALTGNNLTFLDLIAFVVAIPVTLIYRVVEGSYPGDQAVTGAAAASNIVLARVQGMTGAITSIFGGFVTAIFDVIDIFESEISILGNIVNILASLSIASAIVEGDVLTPAPWPIAASVALLLPLVLNAVPGMPSEIPSTVGVVVSPLLLFAVWQVYEDSPKAEGDALGLAAAVIGELAVIVNPIKFAEPPTSVVAPVADIACGIAAGGLTLGAAIESWDTLPAPTPIPDDVVPVAPPGNHRVFLPTVQR